MTKTLKTTAKLRLFRTLALLSMICLSLSSCSPWDSELEDIYQSAQNGDRLSQFAIIEEYESFKGIVPTDTLEAYLWRFIKEGNYRAIQLAKYKEVNEFIANNRNISNEEQEKGRESINLKWFKIGIENNNFNSYFHLSEYYDRQYEKSRNPQDSIKAKELRLKSIELGNENLLIRRDRKAGFNAMFTGGIKWGKYCYNNVFNERSIIPRFILSCSYTYNYVISGVINLLFTAAWWKVLLTFIVMLIMLIVPIVLVFVPFWAAKYFRSKSSIENEDLLEDARTIMDVITSGIFFGFWNYMCFAVAVTNENLVWQNNINCLLFADSSYGIQKYFPILMNWIALLCLLAKIVVAYTSGYHKNTKIMRAIITFVAFLVSYLMAQVGGVLIVIVLLFVYAGTVAIKIIKGSPSIVASTISGAFTAIDETISEGVASSSSKSRIRGCCSCMHWNTYTHYCDCYGQEKRTSDYDVCSNYVPK